MSQATAAALAASTGPRTPEGKAISSRNAITHGLTARSPLLPSEDKAEFEAYRDSYFQKWTPNTPHFRKLVSEFADLSWRLDRVADQESRFIGIELQQIHIDRKQNSNLNELLEAIGQDDPRTLETFAMGRLFQNRTLTNLHRHEDRLSRRLVRVRAEIDLLDHEARHLRALETYGAHRREEAARNAAAAAAQNELLGSQPDRSPRALVPVQNQQKQATSGASPRHP